MTVWLVLPVLVVLAVAVLVVPAGIATFAYWRRPYRVRCPRAEREAQIRVAPLGAAVAAVLGHETPSIGRCSLWSSVPECREECLRVPSAELVPVPPGTPPPREDGPRTILVPLDGHPGSEAVLDTVRLLARSAGATVRLLRVAPRPEPVLSDEGRVIAFSDQETARIDHEERVYLDRAAARLLDVPVQASVRFGEPVTEILEEAESTGAEVIAMASHRRAGAPRNARRGVTGRLGSLTRIPLVLVPYGGLRPAPRTTLEKRR